MPFFGMQVSKADSDPKHLPPGWKKSARIKWTRAFPGRLRLRQAQPPELSARERHLPPVRGKDGMRAADRGFDKLSHRNIRCIKWTSAFPGRLRLRQAQPPESPARERHLPPVRGKDGMRVKNVASTGSATGVSRSPSVKTKTPVALTGVASLYSSLFFRQLTITRGQRQ